MKIKKCLQNDRIQLLMRHTKKIQLPLYIRLDCNILFTVSVKSLRITCLYVFWSFFYYQNILDVKQLGLEMLIIYFGSSYFPPPFILSGALSRYFLTLS